MNFYNRQYDEMRRSFGWQIPVLTAMLLLQNKTLAGRDIRPTRRETETAIKTLAQYGYDGSRQLGVPLQRFAEDYTKKYVKPALDRLSEQYALDPDDISGRNSLRNKAEIAVRWQDHEDNIANLRNSGVKLVICSTHADCSERCRPWQGRVYSLDGTSGTTDDGRKYVPIEQAINIYYTTKTGKVWKNGLFGFNCRHYLVAYESGYRFPRPNVAEERKQDAITKEQRRLERVVRKWRTIAVESKGLDDNVYRKAAARARSANREYIEFSIENNRAYYPSRTKLL